jgi:hypothetical protein
MSSPPPPSSFLNLVNHQNFDRIFAQVRDVAAAAPSAAVFGGVVNALFEFALLQPAFSTVS